MINRISSLFGRSSEALSAQAFDHMRAQAKILEQDARGVKVLQLSDGQIFKLFRVRRLLSLARLYSYARHFCRNADGLTALGIPTVKVVRLLHFIGSSDTAVLYQPLPGKTLRQLAQAGELGPALMADVGRFVADLHARGVYFRSLHFGNVVLTPDHTLGLIDIADLKLRRHPLSTGQRVRNFRHLQRLKHDWEMVPAESAKAFIEAYLTASNLSERDQAVLKSAFRYLSSV